MLECNNYGIQAVNLLQNKTAVSSVHISIDEHWFPAPETLELSSSWGDVKQWKLDTNAK